MEDKIVHGKIVSLQLCPGHRKPMKKVQSAEAVQQVGLKEDMHAIQESARQVLLIEKETLDVLSLQPGEVKENITTEGVEFMSLQYGQKLKIGNSVMLEITKPCSPCSRMEEIRPGLLNELAGRRGMLARIMTGGIIAQGDAITILAE